MIMVRDVPAQKRATSASLFHAFCRSGGSNEREKAANFSRFLIEEVKAQRVDLAGVLLEEAAKLSMGDGWRQHLVEMKRGSVPLLESGQPVTSDFFAAVTGQTVYSKVREAFSLPQFVFTQLIPVMQSGLPGAETIPEITPIGDEAQTVLEAQEYPNVGIGAGTTTAPASVKKGLKIEITEETLSFTAFQGLTASILKQASAVGLFLGYRRELSLIDVVIGFVNNYIRNGTALDTYKTSGAYINNQTNAELVDYTDIDSAEQLLNSMVDPTTGLAIMRPSPVRHLVVMPGRSMRANAIIEATGLNVGDITTGTGLQTTGSPNPLNRLPIMPISSQLLYNRVLEAVEPEAAKAIEGWIYGDLAAFAWKELWPLAVFQMAANSPAAFDRDVLMAFKARYHGVAMVNEPRLITRNEKDAWAL